MRGATIHDVQLCRTRAVVEGFSIVAGSIVQSSSRRYVDS